MNESIKDPKTGKIHRCPIGTLSDLRFLESCGIDPWSSLGMVTYVIGEHPWTEDGTVIQCDRGSHQWTFNSWLCNQAGSKFRYCSKCDATEALSG